ncbi:MAG TPA: PLDc_N domain-containing protein [Leeuwenhoekiella sp.]|nr:PLDc_N domain-containing protein [Leeuwenhoekiella sp.]
MFLGMVGPLQILIIAALALLLPIIALIDILKSSFKGNDKIVWVLVVIFFNFFGSILYFLIGKKQRLNA